MKPAFSIFGNSDATLIAGNFNFTIASPANVSAGVYNASNNLVRTLFSLKPYGSGTFTEHWDGNDDFGALATGGPFSIKVISGNATYTWEGVVGNNSTNLNGNTVLRSTYPPRCMFATSSFVYWAVGYGEAWPSTWKTTLADLHSKLWINVTLNNGAYETDFVCADATNVYWGALDPAIPAHSFVYGTKVSDDSFRTFSSGVSLPQGIGPALPSVFNYIIDGTGTWQNSQITGLAVQQSNNFLISTRAAINTLYVMDKTTGATVQTYTITGAGQVVMDTSDNLWLAHGSVIEKYTINSSTGAITTTGFTISLSNVGGLSINPAGTTIIAADMTAQQVKGYNTTTGALIFTLGTGASYMTNSTVQYNKFYWQDLRGQKTTFLCYMPDGSFLVGDLPNARIQRFASNGSTLVETIAYNGNDYYVFIDPNDPTRLFMGEKAMMEYTIDYSQPLATSWTLKNNWGGMFDPTWNTGGLKFPATLSNGRTYCHFLIGIDSFVVELVPNGVIRLTGVSWPHSTWLFNIFDSNSDHIGVTTTNSGIPSGTFSIKRYPLTGFDGSGNPSWAASPSTTTTTPAIGKNGTKTLSPAFKTTSGNWISFDPNSSSTPVTDSNATGQGYHIGAIPEGGSAYKWGSAQSTNRDTYLGPYPGVGNFLGHWFDSGNSVHQGGGYLCASGDHVFWSYHGENWKQTQTNLFMHIYDANIGLAIGQFGTNRYYDYNNIITYPPIGRFESLPMSAGNALQGMSCTVNGVLYLWTGDEGDHAGVHRWKIENLNTVNIQTAVFPTGSATPPVLGIDLLAGLVSGSALVDGVAGWTRSPTTDHNDGTGIMRCRIGNKNFDPAVSPNLELFGNLLTTPQNWWASRTLNNSVALTSWTISMDTLYDLNISTSTATHGNPIQILDVNGLEICRFQPYTVGGTPSFNQVRFNDVVIYSSQLSDITVVTRSWTKLTISYSAGVITCTYGAYTPVTASAPYEAGALLNTPSDLRLYMYTLGSFPVQGNGVQTTIQKARFV